MATVQGIREKVHLPIYDSLSVEPGKQLRDSEPSSILRFFVNVQKKTKLETNLQSASLLPHYNTFEARAMRVVISDLPPEFPSGLKTDLLAGLDVVNRTGVGVTVKSDGTVSFDTTDVAGVSADLELGLDRVMELIREARNLDDDFKRAYVYADEDGVKLTSTILADNATIDVEGVARVGGRIQLSLWELEDLVSALEENQQPPKAQLLPNSGAGTIIGKVIYNTVTTLYVGEKIMIQMPTWFFPAGAGPYSESGKTTHGKPSPEATFRFAEPIFIDKQQNFRVEIEIPNTDTLKEIQKIYGPLNLWVVLDGYMTRDVQ